VQSVTGAVMAVTRLHHVQVSVPRDSENEVRAYCAIQ
jgi:hypothetical protein